MCYQILARSIQSRSHVMYCRVRREVMSRSFAESVSIESEFDAKLCFVVMGQLLADRTDTIPNANANDANPVYVRQLIF